MFTFNLVTPSIFSSPSPHIEVVGFPLLVEDRWESLAQRRRGAEEELRENPSIAVFPEVQLVQSSESQPAPAQSPANPLIDRGAENIVYLGVALLAITVVVVVGLLSRRVEYALIFAAILSIILIGLFLVL